MIKALFLKPILICILVGFVIFSQAQTFLKPPLNNQKEQIHFLLYLNREIPDLFTQAIKYPTDLLSLLTHYKNLMVNLQQQPGLIEIANQYNTRYKIAIFDSNQKENIIETQENKIQLIPIPEEILVEFISLININSQNLSAGLIALLPDEKKQTAFQLSLENRIAFLRENLPEDIIGAGFKSNNFGLSAVEATKDKLLDLIEVSYKKEWNITTWIRDQVESNSKINYNDVKEFLLQQIGTKESTKRIDATLKRYFPKDIKDLEEAVAYKKSPALVLEEVPVELALNRGFPSCDCSTQYSGLYAALPTERTFWIKRKEKIIGVTTGTIVLVDGKPSFYLHTINGPHVAVSDIPLILLGMTKWMDKNNLNALVLPTSDQQHKIINREDLREKIRLISESEKSVKIDHIDKTMRSEVDKFYTATYDKAEQNSRGFLLPKTKLNNYQFQVEVEPIQYHYQLKEKIKILEIMTLSMALQKAKLDESAQSVLQSFHLNLSDVAHFNDILLNTKKQKREDFFKNLEDAAKKLRITDDPNWMETINEQIELGKIRAPEAFSEENQRETFGIILRNLKKGIGTDFDIATEVIKTNTESARLISANPFTRYMLKLLIGDKASYQLFESIISKINAFNGFVWKTYFFKQIVYDGNDDKFETIVSNFRANRVSFDWNSSQQVSLLEAIKMPIVLAHFKIEIEPLREIYRVNSIGDLNPESKKILFWGILNNEHLLKSVDMHDIAFLSESIYPMNSQGKKELFKKISEMASKAHSASFKSKIMEVFTYRLQIEKTIDWDAIQQLKKFSTSIPLNIGIMRGNINKVTSLSEFIKLLEPGVSHPNKEYVKAINEVWIDFSNKFASFNPTLHEIEQYKKMSNKIGVSIALIRSNLNPLNPNIKTAEDFLKLLEPAVESPSEDYKKNINSLWIEYADDFANLKPNIFQINKIKKSKVIYVDGMIAIIKANLKNVRTEKDFKMLLDPQETPSKAYFEALEKLKTESQGILNKVKSQKGQTSFYQGRTAYLMGKVASLWRGLSKNEMDQAIGSDATESVKSCQNIFRK